MKIYSLSFHARLGVVSYFLAIFLGLLAALVPGSGGLQNDGSASAPPAWDHTTGRLGDTCAHSGAFPLYSPAPSLRPAAHWGRL